MYVIHIQNLTSLDITFPNKGTRHTFSMLPGAFREGRGTKGAIFPRPKMKIRGIQSEKFKSSRYKYEDIYYQIMVMHKKDLWRGGGGG
jgi:hypothetical protein